MRHLARWLISILGIFLVFWTKNTTFWVPWRPVLGPNERGCCEKPFCSDLPRILCVGPSPTIKNPEFQSFFGFFTVFWCFSGRKIRFLRTFGDRCWVPTNGGALKHYFAVIYHEYCTHPPSYPPKYTTFRQNRFLTIFFKNWCAKLGFSVVTVTNLILSRTNVCYSLRYSHVDGTPRQVTEKPEFHTILGGLLRFFLFFGLSNTYSVKLGLTGG